MSWLSDRKRAVVQSIARCALVDDLQMWSDQAAVNAVGHMRSCCPICGAEYAGGRRSGTIRFTCGTQRITKDGTTRVIAKCLEVE